jgi:hypothetical protein
MNKHYIFAIAKIEVQNYIYLLEKWMLIVFGR